METKRMGELYQEIAYKIDNIIPEDWEDVFLYGEVLENSKQAYFYFISSENNKLIYGHDIPEIYNANDDEYFERLVNLVNSIEDLHEEYKENNEKVWTNMTFILNNTGKMKIKFDYTSVLDSCVSSNERMIIWKYEVLGIEPVTEKQKEIINKFLELKNNK